MTRWRRRPRKRDSSERIFPLPLWEREKTVEGNVTQISQAWTESFVEVAKGKVHLLKGGTGEPLLILHRDVGNPGWLPFYGDLAQRFTVYVPSHPGFDKSDRPEWMRNVRDLAIVYQWLLKELQLDTLSLVAGVWRLDRRRDGHHVSPPV